MSSNYEKLGKYYLTFQRSSKNCSLFKYTVTAQYDFFNSNA